MNIEFDINTDEKSYLQLELDEEQLRTFLTYNFEKMQEVVGSTTKTLNIISVKVLALYWKEFVSFEYTLTDFINLLLENEVSKQYLTRRVSLYDNEEYYIIAHGIIYEDLLDEDSGLSDYEKLLNGM